MSRGLVGRALAGNPPSQVMAPRSKEADERWVFKRFLDAQPQLRGRRWRYEGGHHERPDFVLVKGPIGVELGDWLHEKQTASARELERFRTELRKAARRRQMAAFTESFKPSSATRYTVSFSMHATPGRQRRNAVIKALLDLLRDAKRSFTKAERNEGVMVAHAKLPENIAPFISSIHIRPAEDFNLGIDIDRGGAFDPEVAVQALLNGINDKLVAKRTLYSKTKTDKRLQQLWLVMHHGRGMLWNSPYHGIGLKEGRPLDEATSRQIIVERAKAFVSKVGTGPFDRVFLLFDVSPCLGCLEI